jgi:5'-nucleotidase
MLAVEALLPSRPDFVLSGVNHGQNLGEDVLYSGTVAAAMEGLALGIPSIAFSFAGGVQRGDVQQLDAQVDTIAKIIRHVTSLPSFPPDTLLNVNLPPVSGDALKGTRLTRLGRRVFSESLQKGKDPWGKPVYWIGGGSVNWQASSPESDFHAINDGYVSITPLHLDLTHFSALDSADAWWKPL